MFKKTSKTSATRTQRAAFTLIEMMLTLVLSGVLMAGLWNLSSAYIRLFETGQQKAAESRLARALLDQISQDITGLTDPSQLELRSKSAIAGALTTDASTSSKGRSSSSSVGVGLPQFRLAGTDLSLQINTFQLRPPQFSEEEEETNDVGAELEERKHFAPNLRTIFYTFSDGETESSLSSSFPIGLIRRELDWQSMAPEVTSEQSEEEEENAEEQDVYGDNEFFLTDSQLENIPLEELLAADLKNETFLWVPEVVKLRFRYSDGRTWSESWDSKYRKSLPKLIEISLDFDFEQGLDARYPIDGGDSDEVTPEDLEADEEAESPEANLNELLNNDEEDEQLPQYRRVIALPTAFHPQDNSTSSSSSEDNSISPLERLRAAEEEEE